MIMLRFRVSHLMRIVSLLILISMGGCTYGTIKPDDVKEYRYFPEYRGYFPVVNSTVRPDWVLPPRPRGRRPRNDLKKQPIRERYFIQNYLVVLLNFCCIPQQY